MKLSGPYWIAVGVKARYVSSGPRTRRLLRMWLAGCPFQVATNQPWVTGLRMALLG